MVMPNYIFNEKLHLDLESYLEDLNSIDKKMIELIFFFFFYIYLILFSYFVIFFSNNCL